MIKFIDLLHQYENIKPEIDLAIQNVIQKSSFIGGRHVEEFEQSFSKYLKVGYCIGVGNGTDALEIAIEALDIPRGSEIIVPANSFIASAEAVTRTNHTVVFADVDVESYVISVEDVEKRITSKTRAIVAVHLYGHPCNMDELIRIAKKYNLYVIEDCAQAHGSEYKGRKVGSIGDIGSFSFYPGKNLGAYGDGGAITTNNEDLAIKCRKIANHGRISKYDHEFEGRNSRLDGMQAAVLNVKLKYLDLWMDRRTQIADKYLDGLSDIEGLTLPEREEWAKQAYHLFVVRTDFRDELQKHLDTNSISTGVHYPIALPRLRAYKYTGQGAEKMFANAAGETLLSLPIGEHLSDGDLDFIVNKIAEFFDEKNSLC